MKKLSQQSNICKQHFQAGVVAAAAVNEALSRKNMGRITLSKPLSEDEFRKIMDQRVDRELEVMQTVLAVEMGDKAAKRWIRNIREIIYLSGALEEAVNMFFI